MSLSRLNLRMTHVILLLEMTFLKRLWEKIKVVTQRPLVGASKLLVPVLKDALWRKNELKESKSSRSTRKLKRKFISWRR